MKESFDEEKAEILLGQLDTKKGVPGEFLKRCDPRVLANVIREEHPQTMALVLSVLGTKKAGEAISCLPDRVQTDVVVRMANLEKVDLNILTEVENVIREQLESTMGGAQGKQLGGVEVVASILNQMDRTLESELLGKLEETNPELAERIRQLMFTFEDLGNLDDRSIQVLLKEISSEDVGCRSERRIRQYEREDILQYVGKSCRDAQGRSRGNGPRTPVRCREGPGKDRNGR